MRDLPLDVRNAAIASSSNVHDLRPVLAHKIKQRQIAKRYRKPAKAPDGQA
jgi:hypothetical protein